MKNFTEAPDRATIAQLADLALSFKKNPKAEPTLGKGKRMGILFLNPSLRTRLSTQVAAANLGMETVVFNVGMEGWALEFEDGAIMNGTTVEHIKDAAPVLGQYFDVLGVRTFPGLVNRDADYSEKTLNQFIKYSGVPVVSLESATLHPLQSLTDVITILETNETKRKPKVVLTWAPHIKSIPHCVANSFSQWMTGWGECDFVITHPQGYELNEKYTKGATITHNQAEALSGADYVYVKNWSSYNDYGKVLSTDSEWMLNLRKIATTRNARVMHCLPVRRNVELSDEILDSSHSLVTRQAGNRVWAAQAVLATLLKNMK